MSLVLLMPLGLLALAGFVVPLLIHLIRRPHQTAFDFPALRWLRESLHPRRQLRFDDPWLLLVRLLLLSLIALLLAQPLVHGDWGGPRHWIVVGDGVDIGSVQRDRADADAEWRWLAPGFPAADEPAPGSPQPFASLLREFDAGLAKGDRLSVLVPEPLDGLDAERMRLRHDVDWRVVAARKRSIPAVETTVHRLALRHGAEPSPALRYLRAAVGAWATAEPERWLLDEGPLDRGVAETTDWLIWLGPEWPAEISSWLERGGRLLRIDPGASGGAIVWRDPTGVPLARDEARGKGHLISLLRPLDPAGVPAVLDPGFPGRLRGLFEGTSPPPTRAHAIDMKPEREPSPQLPRGTPLSAWLAVGVALAFLVERVMATRRRVVI